VVQNAAPHWLEIFCFSCLVGEFNLYILQNRKKKGAKEEGAAAGAVAKEAESSTKNIQELLTQIAVEEPKNKEHKFWDTQPVPRLGEPQGMGALKRMRRGCGAERWVWQADEVGVLFGEVGVSLRDG